MYTWLGASLAWLLGTALQLMSEAPTRAGCGLGLALGSGGLLLGVAGIAWQRHRPPGAGHRVSGLVGWRRLVGCRAMAALGLACLAWGLTGWRALDRLEQAWPAHLTDQVVQADVRWTGLPQRFLEPSGAPARSRPAGGRGATSGDVVRWRVEAHVLRWLGPEAEARQAPLPMRVQLSWERLAAQGPPRPGEARRVAMRLRAPDDRVNPGVGDGALGRFGRGVRAVGRVVSAEPVPVAEVLPHTGWLNCWLDAIDAWRQRVRDRILERVSDTRAAGVLAGLSVGDQAAISRVGRH